MMVDRNVVVDRDVWSIPQRLSWTGISAGVLVGLVTYAALLVLGVAIGLIVPLGEEVNLGALAGRSALWLGLSLAIGAFLGGLTAGRGAGHLTPAQGRFNGLLVGMVLLVLMSIFTVNLVSRGVTSLLGLAGSVINTTSNAVGSASDGGLAATLESLGISNQYQALVNNFNEEELSRIIAEASPELNQEQVQATATVVVDEIRRAGQNISDNLSDITNLDQVVTRQADSAEQALTGEEFVSRLQGEGLTPEQAQEVTTVIGQRVAEARQQIQQTALVVQERAAQLAQDAAQTAARAAWVWLLIAGVCLLFGTLGGNLGHDVKPLDKQEETTVRNSPLSESRKV